PLQTIPSLRSSQTAHLVLDSTKKRFQVLSLQKLVLDSTSVDQKEESPMNPHSLPTRHGANRAEAERIARPLLWLIKDRTTAHPSEIQWQRMGEALLQGDAPADQLAEWIHGSGGKAAFRQFGDILDEGTFNQSNQPQPLRTF